MIFPAAVAGALTLATLLLCALVFVAVPAVRRRGLRFWRPVLLLHLLLLVVHLFVTFPGLLGWFGSRGLGTRHDERAYTGPRLDAEGRWLPQDRATLRDPAPAGSVTQPAVTIAGHGGVPLRAFRVAAPDGPPRAVVLLVHGLFRSALELDAPASMFWRHGCEVWLLEQRNHGGSGRAPATFGLEESRDVVAAAAFVRAQPGLAGVPLLLFGVSLGSCAVALALPELPDVAGVVLDAPIDDLTAAAHRMLGLQRAGDRRRFFALVQPWRSLVLAAVECWSGFRLRDVRPAVAMQGLRPHLPILLVAGRDDDKAPVDSVQALYDSLPMPPGTKELWIVEHAGHGDAWHLFAADYEQRLVALLQRALAS